LKNLASTTACAFSLAKTVLANRRYSKRSLSTTALGAKEAHEASPMTQPESNHSIDPLVKALRLSFDKRTGAGYYLRAESFFNAASYIDEIGVTRGYKTFCVNGLFGSVKQRE
jgi:predicted ATPase